ncbi:MAG: LCP family protein [Spirochaetia bacterium]|nr:LCP family protein [Spirochaetia bacterium]
MSSTIEKKVQSSENFSKSLIIFIGIFLILVLGGYKLIEYINKTSVDVLFREKNPFGILLICKEKVNEKDDRVTFLSVATIYPKSQRIGFISFLPQTQMKADEPTLEKKINFSKPGDVSEEISNMLNIPIPYYIKTDVDNLSKIVDLIEGVPFFMWEPGLIEGEQIPLGEFILTGSMVPQILNPPVQNETKPAMDLFRYYTLLYNTWNDRENKFNLLSDIKMFSLFTKLVDTNLSNSELYKLSKKFALTEGWHLTSIEIPVKRIENGFLADLDSTALFLKNFKKDLSEHENPFLSRMPRMEIKNGTDVNNLAKKVQNSIGRKGIVVVEFSNASSHDHKNTILLDVAGNTYYFNSIAKTLNIEKKYAFINKSSFTDMTLILGKDYGKLKIQ